MLCICILLCFGFWCFFFLCSLFCSFRWYSFRFYFGLDVSFSRLKYESTRDTHVLQIHLIWNCARECRCMRVNRCLGCVWANTETANVTNDRQKADGGTKNVDTNTHSHITYVFGGKRTHQLIRFGCVCVYVMSNCCAVHVIWYNNHIYRCLPCACTACRIFLTTDTHKILQCQHFFKNGMLSTVDFYLFIYLFITLVLMST